MRVGDAGRAGAAMTVWPDDAPARPSSTSRRPERASVNVAAVAMRVYDDTRVDGPDHVAADGARVAERPLDASAGPARAVFIAGGIDRP